MYPAAWSDLDIGASRAHIVQDAYIPTKLPSRCMTARWPPLFCVEICQRADQSDVL